MQQAHSARLKIEIVSIMASMFGDGSGLGKELDEIPLWMKCPQRSGRRETVCRWRLVNYDTRASREIAALWLPVLISGLNAYHGTGLTFSPFEQNLLRRLDPPALPIVHAKFVQTGTWKDVHNDGLIAAVEKQLPELHKRRLLVPRSHNRSWSSYSTRKTNVQRSITAHALAPCNGRKYKNSTSLQ